MDGLLSFWVLSAVFAVVGAALKGLIRPLSWATLAIATLLIAPGKVAETVNAVRAGEVKLALPSVPPPPPVPSATNSPSTNGTDPVQLDPSAAPPTTLPTTTITTPPSAIAPPARTGWTAVDPIARNALPSVSEPRPTPNPTPTPDPIPEPTPDPIPAPENSPSTSPIPGLW